MTGNVLNALPKSLQAEAKAVEKLSSDRAALLTFYDFPAEHWVHLHTTNPIESTFAAARHRTTRTKNCVSRSPFLGLAFKLIQEAEKTWRRIRGAERIDELLAGTLFRGELPVTSDVMKLNSSDSPPDQSLTILMPNTRFDLTSALA